MKQVKYVFFVLFAVFAFSAEAQMELGNDMVKWDFTIEQNGDEATVIGKIKMVDHWHINAVKLPKGSFGYATSIVLKKSDAFSLVGGVIEPKPIEEYDKYADETLLYHKGTVIFKQKIKVKSETDFELQGSFSFQTCNEVRCLPNYTANFKVKVKGVKADEIQAEQKKLMAEFVKVSGDIATHKNGSFYVLVNEKWNEVPKGNSAEFYKKYLTITQKDEK